jgi:predicted permease
MAGMSTRQRGWWRRRPDRDFGDEIASHIDLEVERLIADGMDPREARARARRAFGNVAAAQERYYEARRWVWVEQLRQDVRYALRTLWRSRPFVAATVVTLAIALTLITVVFAVFNAYVLRPFAVPDPYSVYQLAWQHGPGDGGASFTWREYEDVRARHDIFDGAVAHRFQMLRIDGRPLYSAFVSGNYFEVLRPRLRLGRALADFDASAPGGAPVAVLSDPGWAMLFDRDPQVIGKRLDLHGQQITIVGVARPEYTGLDDMPLDMWLPITMLPVMASIDPFRGPQPRELTIFARLRRGVTAVHANQALTPFMVETAAADAAGGRPITASAVRGALRLRATPNPISVELLLILSPIFGAFGLVLVAACANVSSVMLARALGRQREIGIRLSVGASRGRIVRQLLTEAAIIALLAGAAGLAMAAVVLPAGRAAFFVTLPPTMAQLMRVVPLDLDLRVFGFALAVAALAVVLCALMPALQATRLRLTSALRGDVAPRLRSGFLRNLLVVGQVTASLILLVAAATLARNGVTVAATDLGFDVNGVFSINKRGLGSERIPTAARVLEADAGAANVAVTSGNPLFNSLGSIGATALDDEDTETTAYMFVSPEYFPLLGIPLQRGRAFSAAEAQAEAAVGIVSERTARLFWPGADPIGRVLRFAPQGDSQADALKGYSEITIVGVAGDIVAGMPYQGIDPALVYLPTSRDGAHARALLVRRPDGSAAEQEHLSRLLERVDVNRAAFEVVTLAEIREVLLYPLRIASWIGTLLGLLALVLSVSGLYGLLMYVLGQRTREIGIRMALGATARGVVSLIMRQSSRVVGVGLGIGLLLTYSALTLLDATMPLRAGNVSIFDGWSFAAGVTLVAAAAAVASYFPARRAARVDPSTALRADA